MNVDLWSSLFRYSPQAIRQRYDKIFEQTSGLSRDFSFEQLEAYNNIHNYCILRVDITRPNMGLLPSQMDAYVFKKLEKNGFSLEVKTYTKQYIADRQILGPMIDIHYPLHMYIDNKNINDPLIKKWDLTRGSFHEYRKPEYFNISSQDGRYVFGGIPLNVPQNNCIINQILKKFIHISEMKPYLMKEPNKESHAKLLKEGEIELEYCCKISGEYNDDLFSSPPHGLFPLLYGEEWETKNSQIFRRPCVYV